MSTASTRPLRRCRHPACMMGNAVFDTLAGITPDGGRSPTSPSRSHRSDDFTSWTVKLRPGHPLPRRHARSTPTPSSPTSKRSGCTRSSVSPSSRSSPRTGRRPRRSTTSRCSSTCSTRTSYFPATVTGQLGMVASPTWLAAAARRPDAQPGTGRYRPVQVREPEPGLGHPLRPQRQLVETATCISTPSSSTRFTDGQTAHRAALRR